ncbi:hypothetical protein CI610_03574 [invertebrate metagenome]|uniref:Uncharacterized protein n=1 Tax=invertebrate metagenome TaxID=1711999 RepID=A0A2H9T2P5_9ZZZZ
MKFDEMIRNSLRVVPRTIFGTDGRTDKAVTIRSPKFFWEHTNILKPKIDFENVQPKIASDNAQLVTNQLYAILSTSLFDIFSSEVFEASTQPKTIS